MKKEDIKKIIMEEAKRIKNLVEEKKQIESQLKNIQEGEKTPFFMQLKKEFGIPEGGDIRDVNGQTYVHYYGQNKKASDWADSIRKKYGKKIVFTDTSKMKKNKSEEMDETTGKSHTVNKRASHKGEIGKTLKKESEIEEMAGVNQTSSRQAGKNTTNPVYKSRNKRNQINESQILRALIKNSLLEGIIKEDDLDLGDPGDYFPITVKNQKDFEIFKNVVNKGIDSRLEGFTKSKFKTTENSLGKAFLFNFHMSELPILLRRLEYLSDSTGDEEYYDWLQVILDYPLYNVGIAYQTTTEESSELGDFDDTGWEEEYESSSINDIKNKAFNYGTTEPSSSPIQAGISWSSTSAESSRDFYEKGIEKYYKLHIKHLNDSDLSIEEARYFNSIINPKRNSLKEGVDMKNFRVTVKHDEGKITFSVKASSEDSAKKMVMKAENCPESAIISVKEK